MQKNNIFYSSLLFLLLMSGYLTGSFIVRDTPLWGDEPHYLLIAYSIAYDYDINLYNNKFTDLNFLRLLNPDTIKPHVYGPEKEKQVYSVHNLGFPLVLAPVLKIAREFKGSWPHLILLFLMNILTSLLILNIFWLLCEIEKKIDVISFIVAAIIGFTVPVYLHSIQFFSDILSSLIIVYLYRKIRLLEFTKCQPSLLRWKLPILLYGTVAAYLPWCHIKYALTTGIFTGYYIYKTYKSECDFTLKKKLVLWFLIPNIISGALLAYSWYLRYESIWPAAAYGYGKEPYLGFKFLFYSILGNLIDCDKGILIYSPYLIFCLTGIVFLFKEKEILIVLGLLFISTEMTNLFHPRWWGGFCPPARFLIVIMFIAAIGLRKFLSKAHRLSVFLFILAVCLSLINIYHLMAIKIEDCPYLIWGTGEYSLMSYYGLHDVFPNLKTLQTAELTSGIQIFIYLVAFVITIMFYELHLNKIKCISMDESQSTNTEKQNS